MGVVVAVVSWNTRDLLVECLEALAPEARAGRAEVWVVDNASSDGSPELVRERFRWATLIASDDNLGFGRAVNLVASRAEGDWIAAANADVRLTPGALEAMVAAGRRDPAAGAIAPRLLLPDGATQHSVYPFPTLPFTLLYNLGIVSLSRRLAERWPVPGRWDPDRRRYVPWGVAAFLLVRRTAWEQVGGFDEDQWMYAEDLDLGWRLHRAGWRTVYEPTAVVHHRESAAASKAWGEERHGRWHRSTYAWLRRRRGFAITLAIGLVNVCANYVRAALLTPAAALRGDRWRQPRRDAINAAQAHRAGLSVLL